MSKEDLLCRFVVDREGNRMGESISIDEDILIIKKGEKYLGVPLKHIEDSGEAIKIKGIIEWDRMEEMGEEWKKKSLDLMK